MAKLPRRLLAAIALILMLPAWAAPGDGACTGGLCGASGISSKLLTEAAPAEKDRPTPREQPQRTATATDNWRRYLPEREENYNCALSFGVGGNLSKDGFLGSRVLGQTQTWRAPESKDKP